MTDFDFEQHTGVIIMHDGAKVAEITQDNITLFDDAVIVYMDDQMKS